jgi:SAM-dependent methyltransferase
MGEDLDQAAAWSAVAEAWDEHVDYVDEHSGAVTAAWIERLAVRPGDRVLELAAGPGTLAATWSQLVGPSGRVVVSDLAEGMVAAAARRTQDLVNVTVAQIDASAIDAGPGAFDVVATRMGLMFAPDPARALAEIRRVVAPGGRIGVMTWGGIERNPWMTCVGMAAMVHGVVTGGPPVGPGGVFSLGDLGGLELLVKDAGFVDVTASAHEVTFEVDDLDAHVARVSSLAGPMAAAFAAASPDQLAAVRGTAAELAAPHAGDGRWRLPGLVNVVVAHA